MSPVYFEGGFGVVDVEDVARGSLLAMERGRSRERYVLSGENITEDDQLESAGDGTLSEGTTKPIARALETLGAVTVETALLVEIL